MSKRLLTLFRVESEGAVYYLSSDSPLPERIQALIESSEGVMFEAEGWKPLRDQDVRRILYWEAIKIVCHGDDEPDKDMWTVHRESRAPTVIACSEWP